MCTYAAAVVPFNAMVMDDDVVVMVNIMVTVMSWLRLMSRLRLMSWFDLYSSPLTFPRQGLSFWVSPLKQGTSPGVFVWIMPAP